MLKRMRLGTKLLVAFILVGLLPFAAVSYLALDESSKALSTQAFNQLESIREIKKTQIEGFFSERFGDVKVLSSNGSVTEALKAFENAYSSNGKEVGGDLWKRVEKQYGQWLRHYNEQYGYYDLFLISKAGEVVYTVAKESDLGANLKRGALKDSSLGEAYRKGLNSPALTDFKPYAPSNNEPASFISAPVIDSDGEVVGVVALQISLTAINSIMSSRAGMGETGESYLIGDDYLMRSDSYLDPKNHTVKASFANPSQGSVRTEAAEQALAGKSDNKIIIDYNGNPVLSAFTPVEIGGLNWAMLVEIDEAEAFAAIQDLQLSMAIICIICLAAIIASALSISRSITRPVIQGVELAKEIALGDFSIRLRMDRQDELGELANALDRMADSLKESADIAEEIAGGNLNVVVKLASDKDQLGLAFQNMTNNLNEIMGQFQVSGEQIAVGSGQVSDASQSLSQGATEQASSLEEISASLNQMASQTSLNAENAKQANSLSAEAQQAAQKGSQQMQAMVHAMTEINEAGQNISKIIKTIDEIAFQTNLLALNAAVEAARAGQHGKGFAVVAEEVRNLAARSAKAAEETAELIEGSVEKTENGSVIATQTADALEGIVTGITQVSDLVSEIAAASTEQAQGIAQVNQGITQVDSVTQQNTANAEESAAAAEELSGQAEQLRQILQRFTLRQNQQASRPINHAPTRMVSRIGWKHVEQEQANAPAEKQQLALDDNEFGRY